ncbi:MAG: GTP pyrophosphokinase family protein [Clostridia bacterium]|nr:GTP pyrophosphokinase family protein [Clostridia bacterium]
MMRRRGENFVKLMAYYRCAMMEVETKFNVLNEEFSIRYDRNPINSIKSRLKTFHSIREKLTRKGLPMTARNVEENVSDVAGLRVICPFTEDVYLLTEAFLNQDDIKLIRMKDYIKEPKDNGYRSVHLIVEVPIFLAKEKRVMKVEIQLRTIAMDCWACLEHELRYKKGFAFSEEMAREINECAELSADIDRRMGDLRRYIAEQNGETNE